MKKADIAAIVLIVGAIIAVNAAAYQHYASRAGNEKEPVLKKSVSVRQKPENGSGDTESVLINDIKLNIELAITPDQRSQGLMKREKLGENSGMLFIYPEEKILSFWMKDTTIPLSIAFLDKKGLIVDMQNMQPLDEEGTVSKKPALYALEVNQGWYAKHNITIGDKVTSLPYAKNTD